MGVLSPPDHTTEVSPSSASFHSPLLRREMPGLDALRGIAVLAVVTYHGLHWWLAPAHSISRGVLLLWRLASPGWLGVNLFFVLSGFLITGILIDTRHRPHYWRNFYTRRVLRILPLYIVLLAILKIYSHLDGRYLLVCLFYLANFTQGFAGERYGPLWSLAVEEQFYLVWPVLVRRLSLRALGGVCIASIVLSPLLRYLSSSGILALGDPYTATWLVTDNLAMGALIAVLLRTRAATLPRVRAFTIGAAVAGAAMLGLGLRLGFASRVTAVGAAIQPEPFMLLFAALLLAALQFGANPVVFRVSRPLRFLGYISYGVYLFHLLGFRIYQDLFIHYPDIPAVLSLRSDLLRFGGVFAATTVVCFLSRRYFEEAFLRQKDRLAPYERPVPKSGARA